MKALARAFIMTDEAWRRHANPWSVYTRFAAIPAMIFAVWSRVWIGWWALIPTGGVIVWLWLNPRLFPAVTEPRSWAAKGIYGEKLWLLEPSRVPRECRTVLRRLTIPAIAGFVLLIWGLVWLSAWPTAFGATLIVLTQFWRIDRFSRLYEDSQRANQLEPHVPLTAKSSSKKRASPSAGQE
jgi:hypothetical protein